MKAIQFFSGIVVTATLSIAGASAAPEHHRSCAGMDTSLFPARKQEYASLVAAAVEGRVKSSEVTIHLFLSDGPWSMVYADIPIADPGYFLFQGVHGQKHFKDVWGGMAQPEDRPALITWARKLRAPERLAACFADTAIGE